MDDIDLLLTDLGISPQRSFCQDERPQLQKIKSSSTPYTLDTYFTSPTTKVKRSQSSIVSPEIDIQQPQRPQTGYLQTRLSDSECNRQQHLSFVKLHKNIPPTNLLQSAIPEGALIEPTFTNHKQEGANHLTFGNSSRINFYQNRQLDLCIQDFDYLEIQQFNPEATVLSNAVLSPSQNDGGYPMVSRAVCRKHQKGLSSTR